MNKSMAVRRKISAEIRDLREMESCTIFTGLESCGEHKFWCGPR
jgi:hypothetical protein